MQWVHKDINNMKWNFTQKRFMFLCKCITENIETNKRNKIFDSFIKHVKNSF